MSEVSSSSHRAAPPHAVATEDVDAWIAVDGRDVAVFAQYPADAADHPGRVIVLCHGLGGDHWGYAQLGAQLASHGYVVLHPRFLDSMRLAADELGLDAGDGHWRSIDPRLAEALRPMLFDPAHWMSRVARARALIDSLGGQRHLPVRLAPDRVIVAGHSFGAHTSQLLLGTRLFGDGFDAASFAHPAVVAGILLSPQGSGDRGLTDRSWDSVELPLLVVTATHDLGPHGEGLSWRRQSFDSARSGLKHLAVARDSNHFLGGIPDEEGHGTDGVDARLRDAICALAVAFADRVHGDREAGAWLASGPWPELFDHEHHEA